MTILLMILAYWGLGMGAARPSNPFGLHRCPRDCETYTCPFLDDDEYDARINGLVAYRGGRRYDSMWGAA